MWKGYGIEENAWINEDDLHAPRLVVEFYRLNPRAPRRIKLISQGCFDLEKGVMLGNHHLPQSLISFSNAFRDFPRFSKVPK